jgi:hypothetical protein
VARQPRKKDPAGKKHVTNGSRAAKKTVKGAAARTIPPPARLRTLDDATFYKHLPTAVRQPDDPVVQAMRKHPGSWVSWNEATREIYAVSDDFNEALDRMPDPDDPNQQLDAAPGFHPDAEIHRPLKLLSWESPDVTDDVRLLWGDSADAWLDTPNVHFGGRRPRDLVGTDDEVFLRELLRAVRYGATS